MTEEESSYQKIKGDKRIQKIIDDCNAIAADLEKAIDNLDEKSEHQLKAKLEAMGAKVTVVGQHPCRVLWEIELPQEWRHA